MHFHLVQMYDLDNILSIHLMNTENMINHKAASFWHKIWTNNNNNNKGYLAVLEKWDKETEGRKPWNWLTLKSLGFQ